MLEKDLKVIDFEKCGNVVRFYLDDIDCDDYWGDDWDDSPYEHNAGKVYDIFIKGYIDIAWPADWYVCEPSYNVVNSKYCKKDFKERKTPIIIVKDSNECDDYHWQCDSFKTLLNNHKPNYIIYFDDLLIDLINNANKGVVVYTKIL